MRAHTYESHSTCNEPIACEPALSHARMHMCVLISYYWDTTVQPSTVHTWKLKWEASMATEMGPMVAAAAFRASSFFEGMST